MLKTGNSTTANGIGKRSFMTEDFMLQSETARQLYHDYAKNMPIIDYHNHLSPNEIVGDKQDRKSVV